MATDLDFQAWFAGKVFSTDWTSRHFSTWSAILAGRRDEPLRVLEIGSWEGRSAIFFLRYFPYCRLTCVDTFQGSPEHALRDKWRDALPEIESRFDQNVAEFTGRVEKLKKTSVKALNELRAEGRRFDLVLIDGSHHRADVHADAEGCWPLVAEGGMVIFDDYEWNFPVAAEDHPKLGVDAFLSGHAGEFEERERGYQLIIAKTKAD